AESTPMLRFTCPKCGTTNETAEDAAGTTVECGSCGEHLFLSQQQALPVAIPVISAAPPVRCYDCDCPIPEGYSIRRTVRTGGLGGLGLLLLLCCGPLWVIALALLSPVQSQKVSLCPSCHETRRRKERAEGLLSTILFIFIVAMVSLLIYFLF